VGPNVGGQLWRPRLCQAARRPGLKCLMRWDAVWLARTAARPVAIGAVTEVPALCRGALPWAVTDSDQPRVRLPPLRGNRTLIRGGLSLRRSDERLEEKRLVLEQELHRGLLKGVDQVAVSNPDTDGDAASGEGCGTTPGQREALQARPRCPDARDVPAMPAPAPL